MRAPVQTIQRRMIALMMLTSTAVVLVTGAALFAYDAISFRRTLITSIGTRAAILAANAEAALTFENPDDAAQVLAALETDPRTIAAAIYDEEGNLFATYPARPAADAVSPRASAPGSAFERSSLLVSRAIMDGDRALGTISIRTDLHALHERQRVYAFVVLLAVLGSLGVALAISSWLQGSITRPIRMLAEATRRVSEERDYTVRVPVAGGDEIGRLTGAFNAMLLEIERRDRDIRVLNTDLEHRVALRTAELETTNRELEAFSYSVSHDLRAPVRHIAGFSDLLQRRAAPVLDEGSQKYLGHIIDSARRMGDLIDDLLMFSRMGRTELQATAVSLENIVSDVVRELEPDLGGRRVSWQIDPLPEVQADPSMIRMVLANLVANAVKYTAPRDEARIRISAEQRPGETVIAVRDNGVGFDMAYSAKLFGVFQRLHGAEEFEGTGIGLANVRRIVQRHGGRTWAEGQVDAGATFYFSLPANAEAAPLDAARRAA